MFVAQLLHRPDLKARQGLKIKIQKHKAQF